MTTLFSVLFAMATSMMGGADINQNTSRDNIVWPGGAGNGNTVQQVKPDQNRDGIIWPGATGNG